ncbi:MAG: hypothetical protein KF690_05015 [Bacteroidetes bacterium]|nr:hypothetical protein [Bacteroidota bacterium]
MLHCLRLLVLCAFLFGHSLTTQGQNFGIGQPVPVSKLDVNGNLTVGAGYSGTQAAPANGALIEGRVGIGTATPNANAQLDISSTTRGLLAPRMTSAQRNTLGGSMALADAAMLVYDTNENAYYFWDGVQWEQVGADTLWDKNGNDLFPQDLNARVGIGTAAPNSHAVLDIAATDKGVMGPRMTSAQRTAFGTVLGSTEESMLVYDTDESTYFYWDGTQWSPIGADTIWTKVNNHVQLVAAGDSVGIGTGTPASKLAVNGGVSIGTGYAALHAAPANGLLVEGRIGVGTPTPSAKAIMELSSTDLGFLPPRMTTAQRNTLQSAANPADAGMLVYDTQEEKYFYWDGDQWRDFVGFRSNISGIVRLDWNWGVLGAPIRVELTGTTSILGIAPGAAVIVTPKADLGDNRILYGAMQGSDSVVFYCRGFAGGGATNLNVTYIFIY